MSIAFDMEKKEEAGKLALRVHTKAIILNFNMGDSDYGDTKIERSWVQSGAVGMLDDILAGKVYCGRHTERQYDELVQQQAQARAQQAQA
jgi:hypothetical protein